MELEIHCKGKALEIQSNSLSASDEEGALVLYVVFDRVGFVTQVFHFQYYAFSNVRNLNLWSLCVMEFVLLGIGKLLTLAEGDNCESGIRVI